METMADFLLRFTIYVAILSFTFPRIDDLHVFLQFLSLAVSILIGNIIVKTIKKIWNAFPNE